MIIKDTKSFTEKEKKEKQTTQLESTLKIQQKDYKNIMG